MHPYHTFGAYHCLILLVFQLMSLEQISNNEDELMMREIMGLIYQLTKTADGTRAVQMYGPTPYIQDALNSPHKSICKSRSSPVTMAVLLTLAPYLAAYASIIIKNLSNERAGGYEPRYGSTVSRNGGGSGNGSLLHRHPEMGWLNDGMEPELYNELYNYPPSLNDIKNDRIEGGAQGSSWFDTDL